MPFGVGLFDLVFFSTSVERVDCAPLKTQHGTCARRPAIYFLRISFAEGDIKHKNRGLRRPHKNKLTYLICLNF